MLNLSTPREKFSCLKAYKGFFQFLWIGLVDTKYYTLQTLPSCYYDSLHAIILSYIIYSLQIAHVFV